MSNMYGVKKINLPLLGCIGYQNLTRDYEAREICGTQSSSDLIINFSDRNCFW